MKKLLALLAISVLLVGCKTTEYIEVPTVKTEYKVRTDTINTRDSVHVWNTDTVLIKGDSVIITRWRVKETLRDVFKTSTDTLVKSDTISVVIEKERDYSLSEKVRLGLFYPLLVIVIGGVVIYLIKRKM